MTLNTNQPLFQRMAKKYGIDSESLITTLKATCFKQFDGTEITDEQMISILIVADSNNLNPFTNELYAFNDGGKIKPILGVDGWIRITQQNENFGGIEFSYSSNFLQYQDESKSCPEWCEATIYLKGTDKSVKVREYLDEIYVPPKQIEVAGHGIVSVPGASQTHTKRFLRHKTLIQCSRVAFGYSGFSEPDEAFGNNDQFKELVAIEKSEDVAPKNDTVKGTNANDDVESTVKGTNANDDVESTVKGTNANDDVESTVKAANTNNVKVIEKQELKLSKEQKAKIDATLNQLIARSIKAECFDGAYRFVEERFQKNPSIMGYFVKGLERAKNSLQVA